MLKGTYGETETNDFEEKITDIQSISSKMLRQLLTKEIFEKPTSWGKLDKAGFSAEQIAYIYELPFKLTLDVRMLRSITTFCTQKVDFLEIS